MDFKQKIEHFLAKKSDKQKIIVIYWPTGSWKTSLSIEIAKFLDTEVISTDSRQIFKWLDIWTWKITKEEADWIPHHMIDIINPDEEYSVSKFKHKSEEIIDSLHSNWKIPILCWWTWLYIDSLIYDFKIWWTPKNEEIRSKYEEVLKEKWERYLYDILLEKDPKYAQTIHPNNSRYVIRWLEVLELTWKSKLDYKEEKTLKYDVLFFNTYSWDRESLYSKIDKRVWMMFEEWLIDEIKELLKKYQKTDFWMQTIWYKEPIDYLDWKISLEECISLVQQHNRNYAKKQLTWFKKYEDNLD